jgi:hypothetical protein
VGMTIRLAATRSSLVLSALLALGCEAHISSPEGSPPPDSAAGGTSTSGGGGGSTTTPPLPVTGPTDDELRATDPDLFEVALQYFPGQVATAGRKRLFRLTRLQIDRTTESLLPGAQAASAVALWPRDPLQTNYEYAANLGFSAANFTPLTTLADAISDAVKADPSRLANCADDSPACLEDAARTFCQRAFRGTASEEQLDRLAKLFSASVAEVGLEQASADLVNVTLTSPSYLFRDEVRTDATGRLLPAQLLQSLTYTLADAPPEGVGLATPAADAKPLGDSELADLVDQVLATPAARAKLVRFFMAWLEVKEPQDFDIAPSAYPDFTPELASAMVEDTRAFLEKQLATALPTLRELTEATSAIVSEPSAFLYGLKAAGSVELDPAQRLGIFTQPAVIASHSGPTTTRLVKRGVFFTRKVMCLPLGSPPPDVNTTVPADVEGTERERIENVTQPARCAACHAFINPFGFMQENFDAIGRYRTEDAGKPIDPNISVGFLDEGQLTTTTAVDALRGLTRSLRFQQCFTRQLFRFYLGRDEVEGDDPLLRQLFFELAQGGSQSVVGLLRSLAKSTAIGFRSEEAP